MNGVIHDLRFALRGLRKNPGFACTAILSLALGIGANTTVFTLIRAIFLRQLPVRDPAALTAIFTTDSRTPGLQLCSYLNYRDYRDRNTVFSGMLVYVPATITLTGRGDPQLLMAHLVSGDYFDVLGVQPAVGRSFLPEEDGAPGAASVVVITHALWRRLYGGDARITSRTIELNGHNYQIVGVAPEGFAGLNQLAGADLFVPVSTYPHTFPAPTMVTTRRQPMFAVAGRLKPGVTLAQAEAAMQSVAAELERQYPQDNEGRRIRLLGLTEAAMNQRTRPVVSRAGAVMMAISALVLVIGCGNVANLLLARAAGRTKEIALRLAIGASRARLIRQLVTESLVLSAIGGAAGMLVARWARDILWAMRGPTFNHAGFQLDLDVSVLVFNTGASLATGIIFGLAPALRATQRDLAVDLKERAGSGATGFRSVGTMRSLLVIVQVAFALVTLVSASLFVRSLRDASQIDPGFDAAHLAIVAYNVNDQGYDEARGRDYHERAIERASSVPGVVGVSLARDLPFHVSSRKRVRVSTGGDRDLSTLTSFVWPGYFRAVGIPLLRGRDFSALDGKTAPRVAIVNDTAANAWWPGENPIGKHVSFAGDAAPIEIAGVVRTANYQSLAEPPQALIYVSLAQYYYPTAVLYVRASGDPAVVAANVRRALQPMDRNLMLQAESLEVSIRDLLWAQRLSAWLLSVFGGLALMLSVIGIYGVISFSVRQRRREMGIRMALGASPAGVQYLVLGEGMKLITLGIAMGSIVALGVASAVESLLFLRSARDTFTFILMPAALTLVCMLACWGPAARSSRVHPAESLRDEG
jgi:predicted permease